MLCCLDIIFVLLVFDFRIPGNFWESSFAFMPSFISISVDSLTFLAWYNIYKQGGTELRILLVPLEVTFFQVTQNCCNSPVSFKLCSYVFRTIPVLSVVPLI